MNYSGLRIACAILLVFIVISCCNNSENNSQKDTHLIAKSKAHLTSLIGSWEWIENDSEGTFSLQIDSNSDYLVGRICFTIDYGNKMDCAMDEPSFKVRKDSFFTNAIPFRSFYFLGTGSFKAEMKQDTLYWKVIKPPHPEYFGPRISKLLKISK